MRSRGEAEPTFKEFVRLLRPAWQRLQARLARIERRLADIEGRLDALEWARGDVEEVQQRFEFELAHGRLVPFEIEDLRMRVVGPDDLEAYGDQQEGPDAG